MTIVYMGITVASAIYAKSAEANPLAPNVSAGRAVVGLFFMYYAFYNIAMSPLLAAYTVEILPFALRTKGLFVSSECVNMSLVSQAIPSLSPILIYILTICSGIQPIRQPYRTT
jgi:hypothetical protein